MKKLRIIALRNSTKGLPGIAQQQLASIQDKYKIVDIPVTQPTGPEEHLRNVEEQETTVTLLTERVLPQMAMDKGHPHYAPNPALGGKLCRVESVQVNFGPPMEEDLEQIMAE